MPKSTEGTSSTATAQHEAPTSTDETIIPSAPSPAIPAPSSAAVSNNALGSSVGVKIAAARLANEELVVLTALADLRGKSPTNAAVLAMTITTPMIFNRLVDNAMRSEDSFEFRSMAAIERVMERANPSKTFGYVAGPAHDDKARIAAERFKEIPVKPNGSLAEMQKIAVNQSVRAIRKDFWGLQSYPKLVSLMLKYTSLSTGHLVRDERDAGVEKEFNVRKLEAEKIMYESQMEYYRRLNGPIPSPQHQQEEGADA